MADACTRHPDAPRIGGACGLCTIYPENVPAQPRYADRRWAPSANRAEPLSWRRPFRVEVVEDLFTPDLSNAWVAAVWMSMFWTGGDIRGTIYSRLNKPVQTFLVRTDHPGRMRDWTNAWANQQRRVAMVKAAIEQGWCDQQDLEQVPWMAEHLASVWLGVTVNGQYSAEERIPDLLEARAAGRFLLCAPLHEPLDLHPYLADTIPVTHSHHDAPDGGVVHGMERHGDEWIRRDRIGWIIAAGEQGPKARPTHPTWLTALAAACDEHGVPFMFTGWGAWAPAPWKVSIDVEPAETLEQRKRQAEQLGATHCLSSEAHRYGHEMYQPPHKTWSTERSDKEEWPGGQAPMRFHRSRAAAGWLLNGRARDAIPANCR
ncbi:DUF5131 family protein [Nonomuraea sp. CA-143628]|uniref:DUF5131 family protein n=1 Tax=Nonomuraea sp. CA-143628 TaxID=3239997 RepID=UPI003D92EBA3